MEATTQRELAMSEKYAYLKPYRPNPWFQAHLDAERDYSVGIPFDVWSRHVVSEYQGEEEPRECRCGKKLWYKATIIAYKCPDCGALQAQHGDYIN